MPRAKPARAVLSKGPAAAKKHLTVEVIEKAVGHWNTDIALGWEAGLQGQERPFGGKLYERQAPDHFYLEQNHKRLKEWKLGFASAVCYRELHLRRSVHIVGKNADGEVKSRLQGWSVNRGKMVTRLADKQGCFGDVVFYYLEGSEIVREHCCSI